MKANTTHAESVEVIVLLRPNHPIEIALAMDEHSVKSKQHPLTNSRIKNYHQRNQAELQIGSTDSLK